MIGHGRENTVYLCWNAKPTLGSWPRNPLNVRIQGYYCPRTRKFPLCCTCPHSDAQCRTVFLSPGQVVPAFQRCLEGSVAVLTRLLMEIVSAVSGWHSLQGLAVHHGVTLSPRYLSQLSAHQRTR